MTNSRLVLGVGLGASSLALTLVLVIGGVAVVVAGLAAVVGISAILAGTAAFIVSWKQRSFPLAGLLMASGLIFMINAVIATGYFAVIVIPGPIIGVFLGLTVFGLGVAKAFGTARKAVADVRS